VRAAGAAQLPAAWSPNQRKLVCGSLEGAGMPSAESVILFVTGAEEDGVTLDVFQIAVSRAVNSDSSWAGGRPSNSIRTWGRWKSAGRRSSSTGRRGAVDQIGQRGPERPVGQFYFDQVWLKDWQSRRVGRWGQLCALEGLATGRFTFGLSWEPSDLARSCPRRGSRTHSGPPPPVSRRRRAQGPPLLLGLARSV